MTLPASGQISMADIGAEFYGKVFPQAPAYGYTYSTSGTLLYQMNYYRGNYYYSAAVNGVIYTFPAGQLSMSDFYGTGGVCACDCLCDCACACSNGG